MEDCFPDSDDIPLYHKATWYEILQGTDNKNLERIGFITGYRIYGAEICDAIKLGYESSVLCDFDEKSQLLFDFIYTFKNNIDSDLFLLTSFSIKDEYSRNYEVINAILDMIVESNYLIYSFITNKIIATVGITELFDDKTIMNLNQHGANKFTWLYDELFVSETNFRLLITKNAYYTKDFSEFIDAKGW